MEKIDQVREWMEEKSAVLQAEKESLKGLPEAERRPEEKLITSQQALLDELAQIIESK